MDCQDLLCYGVEMTDDLGIPGQKLLPMGVWTAAMIGLGSMIGGGVFATMGPAVIGCGGAAPLGFLAGGIPAYLTAYSYVRMMKSHPEQRGTVSYFNLAFGQGYFSASLNLLLFVCYACVAALYAGIFGSYLGHLLGFSSVWAERALSWLGVVGIMLVVLSRAAWNWALTGQLNIAKLIVMGVFIAAALASPLWNWEHFSLKTWHSAEEIAATGMGIFMSYQGFELIAATGRSWKGGSRSVAWAFAVCLSLATVYYMLMAFCTVGNISPSVSAEEGRYLLAATAERFMGYGGCVLLSVGAVMASLSAVSTDVFSVSSIPGQMAEVGEMPAYFSPSIRGGQALGTLFLVGLLSLFVGLVRVDELTAIASLGFLMVYALVNFASLLITVRTRRSVVVSGAACLLCILAAGVVIHQLSCSPHALVLLSVSCSMLMLPFVGQAIYYTVRRYLL